MAAALNVLVVTDNDAVREELELGFPTEVDVACARDARDAWEQLHERVPSAVVVDLHTGSAGGYALACDMHSDSRFSAVPIVMLLDRYQDEWLARQAGAGASFVKPVDAGRVLAVLADLTSPSPAA